MMAFFVYVLECADGSYYTGYTSDLERRLRQHSCGAGSRYVRSRLPVRLIYSETYPDRSSAMRREREIKGLSRGEKESLVA